MKIINNSLEHSCEAEKGRLTKEGIWTTYTKFQMNQLTLGDV